MDVRAHDAGRLGLPLSPDMDIDDYMKGKRAAEGNNSVPGVAFTLLIVAPFLFLVYPVLGLTLYVIFLAALYLLSLAKVPGTATILIGVILGIVGFFPAYKLEAIASQFTPYRFLRAVLRPIAAFCLTVALRSGMAFDNSLRGLDFNQVAGDKLLEGIVVAVLAHFILRRSDRIYFPVWKQVRKREEREARGIPDQRPLVKRVAYGLLWFIPVVAVLNLIIRVAVTGFVDGNREIADFYQRYSILVYIFDFTVWFALIFIGLLPGTAKIRKYVVGRTHES